MTINFKVIDARNDMYLNTFVVYNAKIHNYPTLDLVVILE